MKKIIILTFIISVLCGCNRPVAETETAPALPEMSETETTKNLINDTSLNVAVIGTPCWNPHGEQQKINRDAMNFIYEPLYTLDSQLISVNSDDLTPGAEGFAVGGLVGILPGGNGTILIKPQTHNL